MEPDRSKEDGAQKPTRNANDDDPHLVIGAHPNALWLEKEASHKGTHDPMKPKKMGKEAVGERHQHKRGELSSRKLKDLQLRSHMRVHMHTQQDGHRKEGTNLANQQQQLVDTQDTPIRDQAGQDGEQKETDNIVKNGSCNNRLAHPAGEQVLLFEDFDGGGNSSDGQSHADKETLGNFQFALRQNRQPQCEPRCKGNQRPAKGHQKGGFGLAANVTRLHIDARLQDEKEDPRLSNQLKLLRQEQPFKTRMVGADCEQENRQQDTYTDLAHRRRQRQAHSPLAHRAGGEKQDQQSEEDLHPLKVAQKNRSHLDGAQKKTPAP